VGVVEPCAAGALLQALPGLLRAEEGRRAFVAAGGLRGLLAALPPAPAAPPPPPAQKAAAEQDVGFVMVGEGRAAAAAAGAPAPAAAAAPAAGPEGLAALEGLALALRDPECKEAAVASGAPARLVALLQGGDVAVLRGALAALAAAADHPVARQEVRWVWVWVGGVGRSWWRRRAGGGPGASLLSLQGAAAWLAAWPSAPASAGLRGVLPVGPGRGVGCPSAPLAAAAAHALSACSSRTRAPAPRTAQRSADGRPRSGPSPQGRWRRAAPAAAAAERGPRGGERPAPGGHLPRFARLR
jgi:hypothetical protein